MLWDVLVTGRKKPLSGVEIVCSERRVELWLETTTGGEVFGFTTRLYFEITRRLCFSS